MKTKILFEVRTPLDFSVHVTEQYWDTITTKKHPTMTGREKQVMQTLSNPDEIRQSKKDLKVFLFYQTIKQDRWICVVAKKLNSDGFIITCYITDSIKVRKANMEKIKVFYDKIGNTLTVWFGDPDEEYVCEETGEEIILMKDKSGSVIGFEKLNFKIPESEKLEVAFEANA